MLKTLLLTASLIFVVVAAFIAPVGEPLFARGAAAQGAAAAPVIPLEGLDPVLLIQGKEAQGDEKFAVTRGRFQYLFAGAETKAAFEREPARYEIQLGGTCARMGPSTQGNPDLYAVHDGRIFLFGSPACVKAFKEAPDKYLETAAGVSAAGGASSSPTAEALSKGRALVERAVEAAGGAARVDALVSYQEKATTLMQTPQGASEVKTSMTRVFPDKYREERTLPFGTIATVVKPGGGFYSLARGGGDLLEEQRAAYAKQYGRNVLALLRARRAGGFAASAAGPGKVGETVVEHVDVSAGGVSARLGIDPATGRVLSMSYRGRGQGGMFGEVVQTFSDFRAVEGLTLPFKTTGTFNGEPSPAHTSTVESIVINAAVEPSLFEKPKPAGGQ
jgi:YHS domain-containing protein